MRLNQQVARRYAQSLFQLSHETEAETPIKSQQVVLELRAFETALNSEKELKNFFMNPSLRKEEKLEILKDLEPKLPSTFRFLKLLVEADRMGCLAEIIEEYSKAVEEASGEMSIILECAKVPSEKVLEDIKILLEAQWKRKAKIQIKENPAILGGFVAKAPGRTFDASVRSQLRALEKQILA